MMNLGGDEDMLQDCTKDELILHYKILQKKNEKLEWMLMVSLLVFKKKYCSLVDSHLFY